MRVGLVAEPSSKPPREPARSWKAFLTWLVRERRLVLALALLASVVGAVFTIRLYSDLRSGIEELLPRSAPSVVAARTVGPKLRSLTHLSVILEGKDGDALDRLADDLAARMRQLPRDVVESVEYRTDEEEAFLHRFGGLYLSIADLDTIQKRLDTRIAWEKRRANPLLHLLDDGDSAHPAPPLEFGDIERKYAAANSARPEFRRGYFQTSDGRLLVLIVRTPESATGLGANQRVLHAVKKEVEALVPRRYDASVRVGYDGEVATLVEEQEALVSDLLASTAVVLVLELLVLWLYFRNWRAMMAVCGALAVGCLLTFGLAWVIVGHLNANTAFLGSIVVGNGINVSIIVVARFFEERRLGRTTDEAMQLAWSGSLRATFIASFAAGLAYLSLAVTDFRGFNQFGIIGGIGMALCWVTAYLLLPPLLSVLDRRANSAPPQRRSVAGAAVSRLNASHPKAVRVAVAILLLAALVGVVTYRGPLIEYDLSKMGAARSARSGAQYWGEKVDKVFRSYLTPIVIRAESPADLSRVVTELERRRVLLGRADPLREVRTLDSLVPANQAEKLPRLARLRDTLTDARIAMMNPEMRRKVLELRPPKDLRPVTLDDLPRALRLPFVERDGTAGNIALAFPKKLGRSTQPEMQAMAGLIRGAISGSGAKAHAVGQGLLFMDMVDAIVRDGPVATVLAFAAVLALVALVLRQPRPAALVLGSLLLGVAWLVGAAAWARVRVNFLNFVVLPITFGIGADYAVNIVQRWRLEGASALDRVLRETGGAVALCSLTTIIGYGSLLAADNRALRGFGLLAALGELACLSAALVALPAWLQTASSSRARPAAKSADRRHT